MVLFSGSQDENKSCFELRARMALMIALPWEAFGVGILSRVFAPARQTAWLKLAVCVAFGEVYGFDYVGAHPALRINVTLCLPCRPTSRRIRRSWRSATF
jgi:hypothetical protein